FRVITENDVLKIIETLRCDSAMGYDEISPKVIIYCKSKRLTPLCVLINLMFKTGKFPNVLKIAKVKVLYKSGDRNNLGNYRPISVLSVFAKVFEIAIVRQLTAYFEENEIITHCQYGFRKKKSTEIALLNVKENILKAFEENQVTVGIFIDLRKAFDSVDHSILLRKFKHYGIKNIANDLIKNYLFERQQFVALNGHTFSLNYITTGVPQGSNLGPLFFLIFVNEFPNVVRPYGRVVMFADDTNVFINGNTATEIENKSNQIWRKNCGMD